MARNQAHCLNILVIEDNIGDARLIDEYLKEVDMGAYEITLVNDQQDIEDYLFSSFDIILLDLHLSEMSPLKTYKMVQQSFPKVPIVILTGLQDESIAARLIRLGAQDYLIKGTFGPDILKRSIKYSIERKKSQLRLLREEHRTRQLQSRMEFLKDEADRLTSLNTAKDIFLSVASHQLRTPATSVKQYLGMLLEGYVGEIPKKQLEFVQTAYRSNERQLKIVDDLLKVVRVDSGHMALRKSRLDLNSLLQKVIEDQTSSFAEKNQSVSFYSTASRPVEIDEKNIRMVFENLLDNASKYSHEDSSVSVKVLQNSDKTTVIFEDQGIGMSKKDISKLFHKFTRVGRSFELHPNGSGLGLYWAQEIVKLHGGCISVSSKEDKGSKFIVDLPYVVSEKAPAEERQTLFSGSN